MKSSVDYGAQVQSGLKAGNQALDANSRTNQLMMEKIWGGYGLKAPEFYAHADADIQNETDVVKQNFAAKMAEEQVRGQLHQDYMNNMWEYYRMQQRAMKNQMYGAIAGAVGSFAGSALSTSAKTPTSDMGTEELANAGLLNQQGEIDQGNVKKRQQSTQNWGDMLSGLGKSLGGIGGGGGGM